jgi:hypothetical protein
MVLIAGLTVFILMGVFMNCTDPITDRPKYPQGTLDYITKVKNLVCSVHSPVSLLATNLKLIRKPYDTEGYGYLGIVPLLLLSGSLISGLYKSIRRRPERLIFRNGLYSPVWLVTGALFLLFSMGIPFVWHLEWLLDYLSWFRQFRSLGRFNWPFYYLAGIFAILVLYRWYVQIAMKGKPLAIILVTSCAMIWGWEAFSCTSFGRDLAKNGEKNYMRFTATGRKGLEQWLETHHYKSTDFQAMTILNIFTLGTEKYYFNTDGASWAVGLAQMVSYQVQLPMTSVMMSRTSWSEARWQLKTAAGCYVHKPLLESLADKRPFLLLHNDMDSLNGDAAYLLSLCEYLGNYEGNNFYILRPAKVREEDSLRQASVLQIASGMSCTDTCIGDTSIVYINHLENNSCKNAFAGKGAMTQEAMKDSVIFSLKVHPVADSQLYECSAWFLLDSETFLSPDLVVSLYDEQGKKMVDMDMLARGSTDNYGLWCRPTLYFRLPTNCRQIQCYVSDFKMRRLFHNYDEILLRPATTLVISRMPNGVIMANNHWLNCPLPI